MSGILMVMTAIHAARKHVPNPTCNAQTPSETDLELPSEMFKPLQWNHEQSKRPVCRNGLKWEYPGGAPCLEGRPPKNSKTKAMP